MSETLRSFILKDRSFSEGVLYLVQKMHNAGVFHGDMHSENIMVDEDGNPWMIDFGKSKMMPESAEDRKWCIVHDLVLLHNTLPNRSVLKVEIADRIRSLAPDLTVFGYAF